jgi:hypothetical protein
MQAAHRTVILTIKEFTGTSGGTANGGSAIDGNATALHR